MAIITDIVEVTGQMYCASYTLRRLYQHIPTYPLWSRDFH